jgi:hypothetical protein
MGNKRYGKVAFFTSNIFAVHMLSFEKFVKSMPPSLSELKVTPSFCFAFKIPDDVAASNVHVPGKVRGKKLGKRQSKRQNPRDS